MDTKTILSAHDLLIANAEFWHAQEANLRLLRENAMMFGRYDDTELLRPAHDIAINREQKSRAELRNFQPPL